MKLSELKGQGTADRACGSFAALLATIKRVDAEERSGLIDGQNREYVRIHADLMAMNERVAIIVQAYQELGHTRTTAHKLLSVLDACQKEFEEIAGECLV